MECKGGDIDYEELEAYVLIETLWNVKPSDKTVQRAFTSVLIETLWNVKQKETQIRRYGTWVLIETLWNVKQGRNREVFPV